MEPAPSFYTKIAMILQDEQNQLLRFLQNKTEMEYRMT
jgi:hypothetical protein